ncbi:hypothetical protein PMAYCL1PPCAC_19605, partial [Pristionchus mayeri]
LSELYASLVRDEGRDAVERYASQINAALSGSGILPFAERSEFGFIATFNRHMIDGCYCLDQEGRALLSALLTMHSSRVCGLRNSTGGKAVYEIYRMKPIGKAVESLYPESNHTQLIRRNVNIYGRYSEMFAKKDGYSGLIDPITLKQLCFFLNINGVANIRDDPSERSITFELNASTNPSGMKISTVCIYHAYHETNRLARAWIRCLLS